MTSTGGGNASAQGSATSRGNHERHERNGRQY